MPAVVLAATQQSDTAPRSFARYLSTLTHTTMWYRGPASLATSVRTVAAKAAVSLHGPDTGSESLQAYNTMPQY